MIWNPGQFPDNRTLDKLMSKHESNPYNPDIDIANAFFRAGLVDAWGRGIERIIEACKQDPYRVSEWELEPNGLWVTFRHTEEYADPSMGHGQSVGGLNKQFSYIKSSPGLSEKTISQATSIPLRTIERRLKGLRDQGLIEFKGAPRQAATL